MKVSLDWLSKYVDISDLSAEKIAKEITTAGLEVEGIHKSLPIENLVIAYVKELKKHPDADKLNICTVFDGETEHQIVCGAPNVAQGQTVVLAKVGAVLPGNLKIKKAKIRGVESSGMLCSERELGLSESHDGIIVLSEGIEPGTDANPVIGLGDTILEIGITPNRGDCLSVYGVARDVAAVFNRALNVYPIAVDDSGSEIEKEIGLYVDCVDSCPYYTLRVIKGVKVSSSPQWMQRWLKSAGIRPINNVVDITNYIMLEYGQPLHAFDRRVIDGKIIVRRAQNGEKLTTLDGKERVLDDKMTVITDESKVLGLAGVMGGEHSGIYEDTVDVALECAYFTPASTAYTSKKLGINSDSSFRYNRGIDSGRTRMIQDYAAQMISEICGGVVAERALTFGDKPSAVRIIPARFSKIVQLIGQPIPNEEIGALLSRLGIAVSAEGDEMTVWVPSHRNDILHVAGLAEEVARLYGLDKLPYKMPRMLSNGVVMSRFEQNRRQIRHQMTDLGFTEVVNYSFMSDEYLSYFDTAEKVRLVNPLSEEMSTLRTQAFPGIIRALETNWNQGERSLRFFEFATVFEKQKKGEKQPYEKTALAMGVMGDFMPLLWAKGTESDIFYHMKAVCDNVFKTIKLQAVYQPIERSFLHPGKSADITINGQAVGFLGALHPDIEEKLSLRAPVYIAELDFDLLLTLSAGYKQTYKPFSKFPSIYKDIAVVVSKEVKSDDIMAMIASVSPYVADVVLFDLYAGKGIEEGAQSVAYRIYFSAMDRTLTDDEINPLLAEMADKLAKEVGARLR